MIKYIKRKDLEVEKYDACIENSLQSKVYAFSWYLDIVAENWDVLVLDDYKAVMPIPWNRKYFIKYALQSFFCQQIGIYSGKKQLKQSSVNLFFQKIPKSILFLNLNVNVGLSSSTKKTNYELDLEQDYNQIYKNYRKDRIKSLKKASLAELYFQDFDNQVQLIDLYKEVFGYVQHSEKYFNTIKQVMDFCLQNDLGFVRNVFYRENLVCVGFFIQYQSRIYYLFSASSKLGKQYGATTFLIDSVIKEYSMEKIVFDFEGSSIPNVASFYKSFGSVKTTYYNYQTHAIKRIFF